MSSHVTIDRIQFALLITFHYLFPLMTMGLGGFIAYMKTVSYFGRADHRFRPFRKTGEERAVYESSSRFWMKIFALTFVFGVVTGIPMEFQFGTNWAAFSNFAGGVIGNTLAMEGMFAFFFESVFLGIFIAGRNYVSPRLHWFSAVAVFVGSWVSGFFIVATNAWMQHPVAFTKNADGVTLDSIWGFFTNSWLGWQYAHVMGGAALTGSFILAAMGAFYLLNGRHQKFAKKSLKIGVIAAFVFSVLQLFPTGDRQAVNVSRHQPSTFAAMEGTFKTEGDAPLVIIGFPDVDERKIQSSVAIPDLLSFLTYRRWSAEVEGLNSIPKDEWPDSVPLVFYAYHIMIIVGTLLIAISGIAVLLLWRRKLFRSRPILWTLMLTFPFAFIANIAGWTTAETGRQPWTVFGLLRTADSASPESSVPAGSGLFTLIGFAGLYLMLGILFVLLVVRIINQGPEDVPEQGPLPEADLPDKSPVF